MCALVHMECARQDRFSEAPTARPTGFVADVGDQDFWVHKRARAQELKSVNVCRSVVSRSLKINPAIFSQ